MSANPYSDFPHPQKHPAAYHLVMAALNAETVCILANNPARQEENRETAKEICRETLTPWKALAKLDTTEWRGLQAWRFAESVTAALGNVNADRLPWRTVWPDVAAALRDRAAPGNGNWIYNEVKETEQRLRGEVDTLPAARAVEQRRGRGGKRRYDSAKDQKIADEWERGRNAGTAKKDFARDKGKAVKDLNRLLNREHKRKKRRGQSRADPTCQALRLVRASWQPRTFPEKITHLATNRAD